MSVNSDFVKSYRSAPITALDALDELKIYREFLHAAMDSLDEGLPPERLRSRVVLLVGEYLKKSEPVIESAYEELSEMN